MKTDKSKDDADGQLKSGICKEFFKDGAVSCVGEFRSGAKIGERRYYLRKGLLKAIGRFSNSKMKGEWNSIARMGN